MLIPNAYCKVHKKLSKSTIYLVGFGKTKDDKFPLYMVTASDKSLLKHTDKVPNVGKEFTANIILRKDDQFRTWLTFDSFNEFLN